MAGFIVSVNQIAESAPVPTLSGVLKTDSTTAYSAGGQITVVVLDVATHELVMTATATPAANGTWSIPATGAAADTEYLTLQYLADRSLAGIDWLTTSA